MSQTVQAMGGAALLIVLLDDKILISRIFSTPALRYLGKISYGVYLLHSVVCAWFLRSRIGIRAIESGSLLVAILCLVGEFAIVVVIATLSFYFFESPLFRLKKYFEPEKPKATKNERMEVHSLVVEA